MKTNVFDMNNGNCQNLEEDIPHSMEVKTSQHERPNGYDTEQCVADQSSRKGHTEMLMNKHSWDYTDVNVRETVEWIASERFNYDNMLLWIEKGPIQTTPSNETNFCNPELLKKIMKTKQDVFEEFTANELLKARIKANPFETIKSAFFMNRAALKMANIDAATNFMFTEIDRDPLHKRVEGPYYFADICAGPGGFSEYILWRKGWAFKGFGFTLKGEHDFRLFDSTCCSGSTFQGYYGNLDDGNICNPENIKDYTMKVSYETENLGVHFVMADGGFSVEGNENLQEILSKQLYVCQCLVALEIVRKHGHFVTKLFDTFTLFSVGLLFLMHHCFEKVTIMKPNTSRPANSERYFICKSLKDDNIVNDIRTYLRNIVSEFWVLKNSSSTVDIISIVPLNIIISDKSFRNFITECNNRLGENQVINLLKLKTFCQNPTILDTRQDELRKKSLLCWRIPDKIRPLADKYSLEDLLSTALSKPEFLNVQPRDIFNGDDLNKSISDLSDWKYSPLFCCNSSYCNIYAAIGTSRVYRLQDYKWVKVKHIKLIKGTLLYGEIVIERAIDKDSMQETEIKSLHIIDALRLGETSLADLPFDERSSLIRTFCKAVNYETSQKSIRLRAKLSDNLSNICHKSLIEYNPSNNKYFCTLPTIGFYSAKEQFDINSVLFLKTNETQFFNTTYVLRAQLYIDKMKCEEEDSITFEDLISFIKNKVTGVLVE